MILVAKYKDKNIKKLYNNVIIQKLQNHDKNVCEIIHNKKSCNYMFKFINNWIKIIIHDI